MTEEIKKPCKKCGVPKALSEFYKSKLTTDGREGKCKTCRGIQNGEWARSNAKKRRETKSRATKNFLARSPGYQSEWAKNNRDKVNAAYKKYNEKYPEKYYARVAVRLATKRRELPNVKTLKCAECGKAAQEYHHHKGYAKEHWLDVIPLCNPCHNKVGRSGH